MPIQDLCVTGKVKYSSMAQKSNRCYTHYIEHQATTLQCILDEELLSTDICISIERFGQEHP